MKFILSISISFCRKQKSIFIRILCWSDTLIALVHTLIAHLNSTEKTHRLPRVLLLCGELPERMELRRDGVTVYSYNTYFQHTYFQLNWGSSCTSKEFSGAILYPHWINFAVHKELFNVHFVYGSYFYHILISIPS